MASSFASNGVLYHRATHQVLLHHRSPDAPLNPDRWGLFGGGREAVDADDPITAWCRELREELGIAVEPTRVNLVGERSWRDGTLEYLFYVEWPTLQTDFTLGEGQGFAWFDIKTALELLNLSAGTRYFLPELQTLLNTDGSKE